MEHNFLGKADSSWDNQEPFHILCTPQVHYRVRKSTSLAIQATLFRPSFKLPAIPDIPSGPSSSNCSTKILRVFLISPTHFTCHAHLLISADHAAAPYATSRSLAVLAAVPYCDKRGHVVWCAWNCCACSDLRNIQFVTSAMCFRYYRFYFSYEP
jgi:hypothetical protein